MIELKNVKKSYGSIQVLTGVNLYIKRGEFVSVRGKSGVGKTTLLEIIGLLKRPDSGTVRFDGIDVNELDDEERSRIRLNKIGFIFQLHNLIPTLTVIENVELPLSLVGQSKERRRERARSLLKYLGLDGYENRFPETLSVGERQRVAIARSLANQPEVILADEPTSSLDDENSELVVNMLKRINQEKGVTVILTTTDLYEDLPTDVDYLLKDGKLLKL